MSNTGLEVFDRTLQTTHIWLDEIIADLGPSRPLAWHVLNAVLRSIRDRLPTELVAHFGAQLPLLVRGGYYDQWSPGRTVERSRDYASFLAQIDDSLSNSRPVNSADAAMMVFRVLSRHLTPGQIHKVQGALPEPIREHWLTAEKNIIPAVETN